MRFELNYKPYGESAILIEWPAQIDPEIIQDIASFEKLVSKDQKVVDTIVAYNSLTIQFRYLNNYSDYSKNREDFSITVGKLKALYAEERSQETTQSKVWEVPVCYDLQFGLDLEAMAQEKKMSIEELIQLHTKPKYLIYFLGFQPGFLYLGGLNEQLYTPRKANPRLRVEKGAVAIGGKQTGVYPSETSGGWNIIGKSPVDFFDISKSQPCFAKAGEFIQFKSVDFTTYEQILEEVKQGNYKLKQTTL